MSKRRSLREMAATSAAPKEIAGQPADICPYCGAAMFVDGVNRTKYDIIRYIACRNSNCGKRFISRQPPAHLVREVKPNSTNGNGEIAFSIRFA